MVSSRRPVVKPFLYILVALALVSFMNRFSKDAPIEKELARLVKTYASDDRLSGVILVISGKDTVFHRAYGYADRGRNTKNNVECLFPVADVTQLVVRGAAAVLSAEHHLNPDSIFSAVDSIPLPQPVTLRQLLMHRSGLADAYAKSPRLVFASLQDSAISEKKLLLKLTQYMPDTTAGAVKSYNRSNYVLAASFLEEHLHQPLGEWIASNLFGPLTMGRAHWGLPAESDCVALGYEFKKNSWSQAHKVHLSHYSGAANLVCSARDLARWPGIQELPGMNTQGSVSLLGRLDHFGSLPGYRSGFLYMPLQKLTVVVLCNEDQTRVQDLVTQLATLVLRRGLIALPPDSLVQCQGHYRGVTSDGIPVHLDIYLDGDHLTMQLPGERGDVLNLILKPVSGQRFLTELFGLLLNITVDFPDRRRCLLNISGVTLDAQRISDRDG